MNAILDATSDQLDHMVVAAMLDPAEDLRYGNWRGFNFSSADLRGFNFRGADLTEARFDNALITGAVFDDATYDPSSLRKAADYEEFRRRRSDASLAGNSVAPRPEIGALNGAPRSPWQSRHPGRGATDSFSDMEIAKLRNKLAPDRLPER